METTSQQRITNCHKLRYLKAELNVLNYANKKTLKINLKQHLKNL